MMKLFAKIQREHAKMQSANVIKGLSLDSKNSLISTIQTIMHSLDLKIQTNAKSNQKTQQRLNQKWIAAANTPTGPFTRVRPSHDLNMTSRCPLRLQQTESRIKIEQYKDDHTTKITMSIMFVAMALSQMTTNV